MVEAGDWISAMADPRIAGWYECRWFDGDIPMRLWFDGALWLYADGEVSDFGAFIDEDGNEAWRGPVELQA